VTHGSALPAIERPNPIAAWALAARPQTLAASLAPVIAGSSLAASRGALRWEVAALAALAAGAIQIGTNLANDAADFAKGADRADRLGPPRATQRGWLTARQVAIGAAVAFAAALAAGVPLVVIGGWPILLLGLASIAAGVAYTSGRWAIAYLGLGELFVLGFFGLAAVCGTVHLHGAAVDAAAIAAGLALGAIASAILVVNNLRDRDGDARAHKRTLAVRFGARFARLEYGLLLGAAAAAIAIAVLGGGAPRGWLWALVAAIPGGWLIREVWRRDGRELNPLLGRTAQLELGFALLLALGAWS
jgi:1,4-dihydroxy-2-naphthoate octaprenyltransferase